MVAKGFPAKNASYCIPSFTLELKIQTYLFFAAETVVFWYSTASIQQEVLRWYIYMCWCFFGKTPTCLSYVSDLPTQPAPSIPVSFGIPVILKHVSFMSSWVLPNGTYPGRTCSSAFGSGTLISEKGTKGSQDMRRDSYVNINVTLFICLRYIDATICLCKERWIQDGYVFCYTIYMYCRYCTVARKYNICVILFSHYVLLHGDMFVHYIYIYISIVRDGL